MILLGRFNLDEMPILMEPLFYLAVLALVPLVWLAERIKERRKKKVRMDYLKRREQLDREILARKGHSSD